MLETVSAEFPVFVRVTLCGALVVLICCVPKFKLGTEKLATGLGEVPTPVRLIECGLPAALSVIVIAPVLVPVAVGVNVTLIEQFAFANKVAPHVFVLPKSPLGRILV